MMTEKQFLIDMIAHHEMAIEMSNKILNNSSISVGAMILARGIILAQANEISKMKQMLSNL